MLHVRVKVQLVQSLVEERRTKTKGTKSTLVITDKYNIYGILMMKIIITIKFDNQSAHIITEVITINASVSFLI